MSPSLFFSPGIRKRIAISLSVQIMTQLFFPDSGSFGASPYQLRSWASSGDASLPTHCRPLDGASSCGAGAKCFSTNMANVLCFSHLLLLESEFMFSALCSHFVNSRNGRLDSVTHCSEWPWASSGMNLLLPGRPE